MSASNSTSGITKIFSIVPVIALGLILIVLIGCGKDEKCYTCKGYMGTLRMEYGNVCGGEMVKYYKNSGYRCTLEKAKIAREASDPVSKLAKTFAERSSSLHIEMDKMDNMPNFMEAYPLVIRDYFSAPRTTPEERSSYLKEEVLGECSKHYNLYWNNSGYQWPMDPEGNPDWEEIYLHMIDHYFAYCLSENMYFTPR